MWRLKGATEAHLGAVEALNEAEEAASEVLECFWQIRITLTRVEPDPDPNPSEKSDPDPDPYQNENPDSNPDPQHCTIECFAINEWIDFSLTTVCRHY